MPMVGKKKFPYTEKGKKAAETYASAKGMKMHEKKESKKEKMKEYGKTTKPKKAGAKRG
jgi:hypothetical protein